MQVEVLLFGSLRAMFGSEHIDIAVDDNGDVAQLLARMAERQPAFYEARAAVACAVGDQIVPRTHRLQAGERPALLPPVCGG